MISLSFEAKNYPEIREFLLQTQISPVGFIALVPFDDDDYSSPSVEYCSMTPRGVFVISKTPEILYITIPMQGLSSSLCIFIFDD